MKTFEDFFKMKDHLEIDHYTLEVLKEEAIKYVEDFKEWLENHDVDEDVTLAKIEWIQNFFNITDEDKNETKA